jgi:MYXO-CTERM domain-containing protein
MRRLPRSLSSLLLLIASLGVWLAPRSARAFCGFYVSGADAKLLAEATQVVLMREGTRTVLSMQNDYKGPPEGFAMIVPVPIVLQKENVKTLPREVFDRVDKLSAPRLVEYWEQDPCPKARPEGLGLSGIGAGGAGQGFGSGHGRLGGAHTVTIEAQFEVGEYEIVILSAQDSTGLDTWLKQNGYKIPENAEPALRPYVQVGSKFFVAKVNVAKVSFVDGRASLSPLRFHYDSEKLELPVRLGMLNSSGTQDLIVHVLSPNQRYVVTNYPSVTIPTNLDVAEAARGSFPAFYAALLDSTLAKTPGAIVTEYAWPSSSCDPCPGNVGGLSSNDLATLGADVLPSTKSGIVVGGGSTVPTLRTGTIEVKGKLAPEVVQRIVRQSFGRFRLCYEQGLRTNPTLQGKVTAKFEIDAAGSVAGAKDGGSDLPDSAVVQCVLRAFQQMSFPQPEEKANTNVTVPINFTPAAGGGGTLGLGTTGTPGGGGGGGGIGRLGGNIGMTGVGPFVLTRLHARYTKDALGNDLVFKEAPAIVGGREMRGAGGALETGSVPASVNSFQARYAIRHEWKGAVDCKEPRRGVWGGPWPDAGVANSTPVAAQKLAYAPRGNVTLASFVPGGVPELAMIGGAGGAGGSAGASDGGSAGGDGGSGATPAASPSRCGCRVVGGSGGAPLALAGFLLGAVALVRRRRS